MSSVFADGQPVERRRKRVKRTRKRLDDNVVSVESSTGSIDNSKALSSSGAVVASLASPSTTRSSVVDEEKRISYRGTSFFNIKAYFVEMPLAQAQFPALINYRNLGQTEFPDNENDSLYPAGGFLILGFFSFVPWLLGSLYCRSSVPLARISVDGVPFSASASNQNKLGLLIKRTQVDSTLFLEENQRPSSCLFSGSNKAIDMTNGDKVVPITNKALDVEFTIDNGQEGFYNTYFINCLGKPISFELTLTQYNVVNNEKVYLAAGQTPLIPLFGVMSGVYFVIIIVWVLFFVRGHGSKVNRVHHLMTGLLILKMLSLVFRTIDFHFTAINGVAGAWALIYYLFAGAKTMMMFLLIALIGTGWSFVKPFLSASDKQVFAIVIPLQVLDNIALLIVEETAPGSAYFMNWKDVFRIVDILCCGAILIPIIWSIKHLREAAQIDGKAARNVRKLKLFRQFYLSVVSYIYTTRFIHKKIIIYLLDASLPFRGVWVGELFSELATAAFFCLTGYMFKPADNNPYFEMADVDDVNDRRSVSMKGVDV